MYAPGRSFLVAAVLLSVAPSAHSQQAVIAPVSPETATFEIANIPASPPVGADPLLSRPPSEAIGDVLVARGRYLAAIHVYEALPPTAVVDNKLGVACEHMLMFDKSRSVFEAAVKLNPHYAEAYNNLGTLAHTQGDLPRAEKMYKKALKLKPDAASALKNLGTLYYAERKFKKGDKAYQQAVAIDPHALDHNPAHDVQAATKAQSAGEMHYHMAMTYAQAGSSRSSICARPSARASTIATACCTRRNLPTCAPPKCFCRWWMI
jgi:tetratricopeptide (TPR) repeat protein